MSNVYAMCTSIDSLRHWRLCRYVLYNIQETYLGTDGASSGISKFASHDMVHRKKLRC